MSEYNGLGEKLSEPVIECLKSLRSHIMNYDPLENNCRYEIFQELLAFRKSWRELSNLLEEVDNKVNRDLVKEFHENNLCIDECKARESFVNMFSDNFENNIHPAFEMYYHKNIDESEVLNSSVTSNTESFEKVINALELDLQERKKKLSELESIKQEYSELVIESKSMNRQQEELNKHIDPLKKTLEIFNNYLSESDGGDNEGFCPNTLLELHKNLRPIYLYFNTFMDRINSNNENDKVIDITVDEYGQVIIVINKPLSKIAHDTISQNYQDFLSNIFPIKLEFSTMNTLSSREVILLSVVINTEKQLKYHIFSDILFDKDNGDNIPLIDEETMDILPSEVYGQPYYWLQYFVNNKEVIPLKINEININPNDIFRIIEYRIQNFVFFNYMFYLLSVGNQEFINFIIFHSEIQILDAQIIEINMEKFDFKLVNERNKYSLIIKTNNKTIYVDIELSANMSFSIKCNEMIHKEEFKFIDDFNSNNLYHNKQITTNFCKKLCQILSNVGKG